MTPEKLRRVMETELTPRQRQVVELLMENRSLTETARLLGVCPSTVARTRDRAYIRIYRCLRYCVRRSALDKLPMGEYNEEGGDEMTEKEMKEILEKQLRQLFEYSEKVGPVGLQEIIECEMKVINFLRGLENSQTESSQDDRFSVR